MPRLQTYLPDDLYEQVKARDLPASELLQKAVRAELRRLELLDELDKYLAEMHEELGAPSEADHAWAAQVLQQLHEVEGSQQKAS